MRCGERGLWLLIVKDSSLKSGFAFLYEGEVLLEEGCLPNLSLPSSSNTHATP